MQQRFTVTVSATDTGATLATALAARAAGGRAEVLVFESQELVDFFNRSVQRKLPRSYDLVLCGPAVVHTDWDGRLVRPRLMDELRRFLGPVRWFSAEPWQPEDRRAVEQVIGRDNLAVDEDAESVAELVRRHYTSSADEYAEKLADWAAGRDDEEPGAEIRKVLTALKGDRRQLAAAIVMLSRERVQKVVDTYAESAEKTQEENRRIAAERAEEPVRMNEMELVRLELPEEKHPFWAEISEYARREADAELALCRLSGRPTLLLTRDEDVRADLRSWARYVTDLLPGARSVGARPDVVPLVVEDLVDRPELEEDVLNLMSDGAHLLKG